VYVSRLGRPLRRKPIHVLLYVSSTEAFASEQAPFARTLRSLGVPVKTKVFEGHHDFDLWAAHMGLALEFAGDHLSGARGG
jgi:acetyl esterase/lipase